MQGESPGLADTRSRVTEDTPSPWRDKDILERAIDAVGDNNYLVAAHLGCNEFSIRKWRKVHGIHRSPARGSATPNAALRATPGDQVSREEMLEQEVRELRTAVAKYRDGQMRDQRVLELLEEHIGALEPRYAPGELDIVHATGTEQRFLLLWSDLHAAERVFADQMNGINEYDWDIMLKRHDRLRDAIVSFKQNRPYPVPVLHIAALGDMITGGIHEELRETNDRTVMEAALQLGLDGAAWIESLVPHFERIELDGVVGNHGRLTKKPQAKNAHDNFDWMVYHVIALRLAAYESVVVRIPKSAFTAIRIFNRTILAFHGDGIRSTMPGVPWGGVARRVRELERQFRPVVGEIDHFVLGHFHQSNVVDGRKVIVNGSVKGPDEYSIKQFGGGAFAEQLLLSFHPERGLTDVSFIDLQAAR